MLEMDATGKSVFLRSYSLTKEDGTKETWEEVARRVTEGNIAWLPKGAPYTDAKEREACYNAILTGQVMPAGRHLRTSGTPSGSTAVFNCFVTGWSKGWARGHGFLFERLLEGGGVGTNYSVSHMPPDRVLRDFDVEVVYGTNHADAAALKAAGGVERTSLKEDDTNVVYIGVPDSREGWVDSIQDLIGIHFEKTKEFDGIRRVVFDVSNVRPSGSPISGSQGTASGPEPLCHAAIKISDVYRNGLRTRGGRVTPIDAMDIDHALSFCVQAGGVRRSARMSMLDWRDPHVFDFIHCKNDGKSHWTTNISVVYDDDFLTALSINDSHAKRVLKEVFEGMYHNGEPGLWNHTLSQEGEDRGEVIATNPCGEIPLPEFGNCNLGHLNMDTLMAEVDSSTLEGEYSSVRLLTRYLIRATEAHLGGESEERLRIDRRLGLGLLNIVLAMAKRGMNPRTKSGRKMLLRYLPPVIKVIEEEAASYSNLLGIPHPVKTRTIAPTGSVSFLLTGATSGAQPPVANRFIRRVRYQDNSPNDQLLIQEARDQGLVIEADVERAGVTIVQHLVEHAGMKAVRDAGFDPNKLFGDELEWSLEEHAEWLAFLQDTWADNAISYTATFDQDDYTANDICMAVLPRLRRLKGFTALPRDNNYAQLPIEWLTKEEFDELRKGQLVERDSDVDENCAGGACPI